jgi:hypothetical protein
MNDSEDDFFALLRPETDAQVKQLYDHINQCKVLAATKPRYVFGLSKEQQDLDRLHEKLKP